MKKTLLICLNLFVILASTNAQAIQLWGLTPGGGTTGEGTIFNINTDGTGFNTVFSFASPDGWGPKGNLMQASNGKFYGACINGGSFLSCTIFTYDPVTNTHTDVYDFDIIHGDYPTSGLVEAPNGQLYGTTSSGGANGNGVIYTLDPSNNTYTDLFDFSNSTGFEPYCSPIVNNNKLYGTTNSGGTNGLGVIYSFDLLSHIYTDLFDFDLINGSNPKGSLIKGNNGKFYGMTTEGGINNSGVIYSFDPNSLIFQKLFDLSYPTGTLPKGALIQGSNGKLYGVTQAGGASNNGVIFCVDLTNNSYVDLYDFSSISGAEPLGSLYQAQDGKLYGTTSYGGTYGFGGIFSFDLTIATYNNLFNFNGVTGHHTECSFVTLIPTGIAQLSIALNQFSVYPNPATNKITINIPTESIMAAQIKVKSLTGQDVLTFSSKETAFKNKTIDITSLTKGVYYVEIMLNRKSSIVKFTKD